MGANSEGAFKMQNPTHNPTDKSCATPARRRTASILKIATISMRFVGNALRYAEISWARINGANAPSKFTADIAANALHREAQLLAAIRSERAATSSEYGATGVPSAK
jgi:hypothetical protein